MGQLDVGSTGAYRPDYLRVVADALNYLANADICPGARPYVLLMFSVSALSGLLAQLDAVARNARDHGIDCEYQAETLGQAKEIMNRALGLIKGKKATMEVAIDITSEVSQLIGNLAFQASICLAMAGVAVVAEADHLEDATG